LARRLRAEPDADIINVPQNQHPLRTRVSALRVEASDLDYDTLVQGIANPLHRMGDVKAGMLAVKALHRLDHEALGGISQVKQRRNRGPVRRDSDGRLSGQHGHLLIKRARRI